MLASSTGCIKFLEVLKSHKEYDQNYIDAQAKSGMTALILASQNGHHYIVDHLLHHGAKTDHPIQPHGYSALMAACKYGYENIAETLIKNGAEVHREIPGFGYTALHLACSEGHLPVVKLLIRNGANPRHGQFDFSIHSPGLNPPSSARIDMNDHTLQKNEPGL